MRRLLADQRVGFLVVGGINTVVGYAVYAAAFHLLDSRLDAWAPYVALVLAYGVGMLVAFPLHRRFVFRVHGSGSVVRDFGRFVTVNLTTIGVNFALLALLVDVVHLHPLLGQAVALVVSTLLSFVGHRYFSFARGPSTEA